MRVRLRAHCIEASALAECVQLAGDVEGYAAAPVFDANSLIDGTCSR